MKKTLKLMAKEKWTIDKKILIIAECYMFLPVIIFMFGWLKLIYAYLGCFMIIGLAMKLYESFPAIDGCGGIAIGIVSKENVSFWISVIAMAGIWVYLSGIGSYAYQNGDYWVRNPIFNDLSTYSWPVFYNLSEESELVKSICGSDTVAFSYYFSWWLPVCMAAKLFHLSYGMRNLLLYAWALVGILLIIYLICRKLRRCSWVIPVILAAFSGLDAIPFLMKNNFFELFPWVKHMEWWAGYFQYSSNTTQLFWVFNQSIPIWLIMAVFLQLVDAKCIAGLLSVAFAYSPWATFGMVPYAISASVKGRKEIKSAINIFNIFVPVIMLIVFGSFYMSGSASDVYKGLIFMQYPGQERRVFCNYLLFALFEFGVFYFVMGKAAVKYKYYWITLFELILFPLFVIRDGNFIMRGAIPALFMLMVYVTNYLIENRNKKDLKIREYILIGCLIIGSMNPLAEINRTLVQTSTNDNVLQEQIGSFGNMQTDSESLINIAKDQFFVYDYQEKLFFKYLAK